MKKILLSIMLLGIYGNLLSQDIIYKIDGGEIKAKIEEIGSKNIKYKKYENIQGPIYNIEVSKVSKIKFENGYIENFNENSQKDTINSTKVDTKELDDSLYINKTDIRKYLNPKVRSNIIYDYPIDASRVIDSENITYYGLDFTYFTLINYKRVGAENSLSNELATSASIYNQNINVERLKDDLKKTNAIKKSTNNLSTVKRKKWIQSEPASLSINKIDRIVKKYKDENKDGVGFVIIAESFDKTSDLANIIFTFFDIKTGNLLWIIKAEGNAGGIGFANHWAEGIIKAYETFINSTFYYTYGKAKKFERKNRSFIRMNTRITTANSSYGFNYTYYLTKTFAARAGIALERYTGDINAVVDYTYGDHNEYTRYSGSFYSEGKMSAIGIPVSVIATFGDKFGFNIEVTASLAIPISLKPEKNIHIESIPVSLSMQGGLILGAFFKANDLITFDLSFSMITGYPLIDEWSVYNGNYSKQNVGKFDSYFINWDMSPGIQFGVQYRLP